MSGKLDGRVAVITGASSGIGLAVARGFTAEGARVFMMARREAPLRTAAAEIGPLATAVPGDVTRPDDLAAVYDTVRRQAGQIDVVVAAASAAELMPLEHVAPAHVDRILDTNVKGTLFTVQGALPLLRDGGAVILAGSASSQRAAPAFGVYGASKAAIRAFARVWAMELRQRRIRINVLSPGPVDTPALDNLLRPVDPGRQMKARLASLVPLGRLGGADEVARAAVFLASDDASFVNGIELFVDGGYAQI